MRATLTITCLVVWAFAAAAAQTRITSTSTVSTGPACSPPASSTSMLVTADCIDPRFNQPYVDIDEQRTRPVPHRYVHGGFTGTDARFSFYFPPTEQYQRRFFQITHQFLTSENTTPGNIGFAVASGAYFVQTNMGGVERATTTEQAVFGKLDPSVGGYRVNAEAAKYSRIVAARIYGEHRPVDRETPSARVQLIRSRESPTPSDGSWVQMLWSVQACLTCSQLHFEPLSQGPQDVLEAHGITCRMSPRGYLLQRGDGEPPLDRDERTRGEVRQLWRSEDRVV